VSNREFNGNIKNPVAGETETASERDLSNKENKNKILKK
jgi:hypothetical protein